MTFAEEIEEAAGGDAIEGIVIGSVSSYGTKWPVMPSGLIPWSEARPLLDRDYDAGHGLEDCPSLFAWTASRVLFVDMYDGATGVCWVPRHPDPDARPYMPGGG